LEIESKMENRKENLSFDFICDKVEKALEDIDIPKHLLKKEYIAHLAADVILPAINQTAKRVQTQHKAFDLATLLESDGSDSRIDMTPYLLENMHIIEARLQRLEYRFSEMVEQLSDNTSEHQNFQINSNLLRKELAHLIIKADCQKKRYNRWIRENRENYNAFSLYQQERLRRLEQKDLERQYKNKVKSFKEKIKNIKPEKELVTPNENRKENEKHKLNVQEKQNAKPVDEDEILRHIFEQREVRLNAKNPFMSAMSISLNNLRLPKPLPTKITL